MVSRGRLAILVALGVGALGVLAVLAFARPSAPPRTPTGTTGFDGSVRPVGLSAGRFVLRDERGRTVKLASYRGDVVVVAFVYSTCRDTCPITVQQIRGALDQVDRPDVRALLVSVDPRHDDRSTATRFLSEQWVLGRMPYLMGDLRRLRPVWRTFAVQPEEKGREHAVSVVLVDRRGRQRVGFHASDLTADAIAHDVEVLARRAR